MLSARATFIMEGHVHTSYTNSVPVWLPTIARCPISVVGDRRTLTQLGEDACAFRKSTWSNSENEGAESLIACCLFVQGSGSGASR